MIDKGLNTNAVSYPLADKVVDINLGLDRIFALIFMAGGKWRFDDSNHAKYPVITTNLTSGQRDYSFTTDEQGNVILDIYKIAIAQPNGTFIDIYPDNAASIPNNPNSDPVSSFYDGLNTVGTPQRYDKMANGILLDPIPNYTVANGLLIYINREASYFTVSDTTKSPGFSGLFHKYLVLFAKYEYASRKGLSIAGGVLKGGIRTGLNAEIFNMEQDILVHYGNRERDTKRKLIVNVENNK